MSEIRTEPTVPFNEGATSVAPKSTAGIMKFLRQMRDNIPQNLIDKFNGPDNALSTVEKTYKIVFLTDVIADNLPATKIDEFNINRPSRLNDIAVIHSDLTEMQNVTKKDKDKQLLLQTYLNKFNELQPKALEILEKRKQIKKENEDFQEERSRYSEGKNKNPETSKKFQERQDALNKKISKLNKEEDILQGEINILESNTSPYRKVVQTPISGLTPTPTPLSSKPGSD